MSHEFDCIFCLCTILADGFAFPFYVLHTDVVIRDVELTKETSDILASRVISVLRK